MPKHYLALHSRMGEITRLRCIATRRLSGCQGFNCGWDSGKEPEWKDNKTALVGSQESVLLGRVVDQTASQNVSKKHE